MEFTKKILFCIKNGRNINVINQAFVKNFVLFKKIELERISNLAERVGQDPINPYNIVSSPDYRPEQNRRIIILSLSKGRQILLFFKNKKASRSGFVPVRKKFSANFFSCTYE